MSNTTTLDLAADVIDVRDIIARFEELEGELERHDSARMTALDTSADCMGGERTELEALAAILDELKGYGGDEEWRGDWYPVTLICDSHFTDYARELLEDCGTVPADLPSWVEIDWEATARNVRVDYTPVEIDGLTYWYR